MAYCTINDIMAVEPADSLLDLTDDEGAGSIVDSRVNAAIDAADAEIDSHLHGRAGELPLSPVPELIKNLSCEIAIIRLYKRRFGMNLPEGVRERLRATEKKLADIQAGRSLVNTEHREMAPSVSAIVSSPAQRFTASSLGGY
jgi:phage gp36-like protein